MNKLAISLFAGAAAIAVAAPAIAQNRTAPQTDMTRAGVQERTQKAFERMDANKDGKIDTADREARRKAMFDRMDADKNGQISSAEFSAMHANHQRGDRAGAGKQGEHAGHKMGMRGQREAGKGMGRTADANNDGAITLAEMQAAALARFDRADADKNGTVTSAERKAQRDQMRQQMQQRRAQPAG